MLGDDVKVTARELSVTKPEPSRTQTTSHGSLRWLANTLGSYPLVGPGSTGGSGACLSDVGCADHNKSGARRLAMRLSQKLGSQLTQSAKR